MTARPEEPRSAALQSGAASGPARPTLALVLVVSLALRLLAAARGSLHLDDLHSLHHARAGDWASFLAVLRRDNHPPLSFALLRGVRALCGESLLALRLPAVLAGTLLVWPAWRLAARAAPGLGVRAGAALFVAVSSLALEGGRDLRMYALLALAVAGALEALLRVLSGDGPPRRAATALAVWTWVGLHTHYHFLHALFVLGLGTLACLALHAPARARWRPAALALGAALLGALPWALTGFAEQLGHGLAPGGSQASLARLAQSYAHLLTHETRVAPDALRAPLFACGALAAALAGLGWLRLARRRGPDPLVVLCLASAFALPAWSALVVRLVPRAGYEWRYVVGALAPFAACFGCGAFAPGAAAGARRAAGSLALAGALALALLHALDRGREDYLGAARAVLARAGPEDGVVAADWQPALFPHGGAWRFYAARLGAPGRLPREVEHTDDFSLADERELDGVPRVFAILRSIPDGVGLLRVLRARYALETKERFGEGIWLLTFEEPRAATTGG